MTVVARTDPSIFVQTVKHKILLFKTEFYFQRGYKYRLIVDFCHVLYSWWKWIGHFEICREIYWLERQAWQPTPVFLPGESHNGNPFQYSCLENPMDGGAWWAAVHGVVKSRTRLHFDFSLSCIGEGNGNPFQCSCLENPRDGGAWWATVYGVTQSETTEVT